LRRRSGPDWGKPVRHHHRHSFLPGRPVPLLLSSSPRRLFGVQVDSSPPRPELLLPLLHPQPATTPPPWSRLVYSTVEPTARPLRPRDSAENAPSLSTNHRIIVPIWPRKVLGSGFGFQDSNYLDNFHHRRNPWILISFCFLNSLSRVLKPISQERPRTKDQPDS
jgi:hypothetical protein